MSERQQQRLSGGVRRTTRRTVDAQTTFQAEIDNWIAVAKKSSSNKQQEQEEQDDSKVVDGPDNDGRRRDVPGHGKANKKRNQSEDNQRGNQVREPLGGGGNR